MPRVYLSGNPVHDRVLRAFAEGCKGELVEGWNYEPSDVAVIFGVYKSKVKISWPRGEIFRRQRENKKDVIVLETGYINRGDGENHHYAAGFNGLNGRADFRNKDMPDHRAMKLRRDFGMRCLAWRESGKHILLCGQVPWDASVDHIHYEMWLYDIARQLQGYTKRPIRFRPHPLANIPSPKGCKPTEHVSIFDDFEDCWAVVTFNSNSGVEALMHGIPVVALDAGAMYYHLAEHWVSKVDSPYTPNNEERAQWLNNLAFCQWTLDEMSNGEAWQHLSR